MGMMTENELVEFLFSATLKKKKLNWQDLIFMLYLFLLHRDSLRG